MLAPDRTSLIHVPSVIVGDLPIAATDRRKMGGARTIRPDTTESASSNRCADWVPHCGIATRLKPRAPMIAPTVFAAYASPICRPTWVRPWPSNAINNGN